MQCTITSTDAKHGFQLVTSYITDPQRDTVLMSTRLQPVKGSGTGGTASASCRSTRDSTRT